MLQYKDGEPLRQLSRFQKISPPQVEVRFAHAGRLLWHILCRNQASPALPFCSL